nr:TadE/TadG family type IV pilus assembly protein [Caenibius tardaugens]
MALILPLLVTLLFGGSELGYYFYNQHQVVKGVRDGARFASRQSFVGLNCNNGDFTVTAPAATPIQEVTRTGQVSGGTPRVPGWVNDNITVEVTCPETAIKTGIYKNEANAPQINITANVHYRSLFDGVGIIDSTYMLNATQQAAVMGI